MDGDKYTRSITLVCSTCASTDFEHDGEHGPYRCVSCDRIFARDELMRENGHIIDAAVDEVGAEVLKDAQKEITDMFRKAFSRSKYIKIK